MAKCSNRSCKNIGLTDGKDDIHLKANVTVVTSQSMLHSVFYLRLSTL